MFSRLYVSLGVAAAIAVLAVGYVRQRDQKVETRTVAKIERATHAAVKKGKRAAERSAAVGVRGQRDPTTRDD